MSQVHFAQMPNISIPRTKMKTNFNHKLTFNFADIVPVFCREVLPGDTFRVDFGSLIRMSTPIAPIMDNIRASLHAFFIPMRLVWEHTEEFYGANKTSAGPQTTSYLIPAVALGSSSAWQPSVGSVSDYLGKPVVGSLTSGPMVSVLKERAYWLTVNEWYRAEQIQNPWIIDRSDNGAIASRIVNGVTTNVGFADKPAHVTKQFDYFTACTTSPQYGAAVTLPLGSYAPLAVGSNYNVANLDGSNTNKAVKFGLNGSTADIGTDKLGLIGSKYNADLGYINDATLQNDTYQKFGSFLTGPTGAGSAHLYTNLVADLSNATAATVNTLRYAFAVQKYLERSNFGQNRFFEILNVHYGVSSPDARLQRPEHLGEFRFGINIQTVLTTAGHDTSVTTEVGRPGANSTTSAKGHLFRKGFVEPGYILILLSTYQDHTYGQGVMREDLRRERFEFYTPEFANLGDMPVFLNEIKAGSNQNSYIFGYQEHWAEYRYMPDRVSGLLRPDVSGALDYWTLADNFATNPSLSEAFITENRDNISRALVTGATGPDFVADFYFDVTAVRPMPAYTIPGLIDHFGTR